MTRDELRLRIHDAASRPAAGPPATSMVLSAIEAELWPAIDYLQGRVTVKDEVELKARTRVAEAVEACHLAHRTLREEEDPEKAERILALFLGRLDDAAYGR